jgi:hypothetical protein
MLGVYKSFAEDYMAIPVLRGLKTDAEKFAGTVRTSHNLGQNFAKAFDVTYQTKDKTLDHVWATSWGVSTRLIGAVIMAHSDDKGLVLPPSASCSTPTIRTPRTGSSPSTSCREFRCAWRSVRAARDTRTW